MSSRGASIACISPELVAKLRNDDALVVWKLDRLGRNLAHLVNTVQDLSARGVGLRVHAGQGGAQIGTTTAAGRLVSGIFAALAEFERELIRERTRAGLKGCPSPRAQRGKEVGGSSLFFPLLAAPRHPLDGRPEVVLGLRFQLFVR